jgi:peptidyl-prolyl cis-trans isomerase D
VGEVSQPIMVDNQYVIALLTDVKERGVPTFENVKDKMREEAVKEAKANKYAEMMKTGSLQDIATAVQSTVKKGENITLRNANIPGSNVSVQEPEVLGMCFGLKKDFISAPIKGKGGVYVIQRTSDVTEGQSQDNYVTDRNGVINTLQARAAMSIFNSLKEQAEVEDNRFERR